MKTVFRQIAAFSMALIVMLSTMSFSINKHYCMDHLVDVSLVLPADSCGMDMGMSNPESDAEEVSKTPCCIDEQIAVEGQDEINPSSELTPEFSVFVASFVYSYTVLFAGETAEQPDFKDYSPPLISRDLPVLYETYLI